jgi:hypothetical protein
MQTEIWQDGVEHGYKKALEEVVGMLEGMRRKYPMTGQPDPDAQYKNGWEDALFDAIQKTKKMTNKKGEGEIVVLLEEIKNRAMEHPSFDAEIYETEDYEMLIEVGGDTAEWTEIAIAIKQALAKLGGGER